MVTNLVFVIVHTACMMLHTVAEWYRRWRSLFSLYEFCTVPTNRSGARFLLGSKSILERAKIKLLRCQAGMG